jgi:hypothetical protein
MIQGHITLIKRGQCRSFTYSYKDLNRILTGIGAKHWVPDIEGRPGIICHVLVEGQTTKELIQQRKSVEQELRSRIHPRLEMYFNLV